LFYDKHKYKKLQNTPAKNLHLAYFDFMELLESIEDKESVKTIYDIGACIVKNKILFLSQKSFE